MNSKSPRASTTSSSPDRAAPDPERPKRKYNSTRRTRQAAQTREEVLAAAVQLFDASGWAATTIAGVAAEAGVAVETIYSGFGSKKAVLRAAMDAAIVGDARPIPFADREEAARMGQGDFDERVAAAADVTAAVHERSAGVWRAIIEAAAGDPEIDGWRRDAEAGRRIEVERSLRAILGREPDPTEVDLAFLLFGPEIYLKVIHDLGRAGEGYRELIREGFVRWFDRR